MAGNDVINWVDSGYNPTSPSLFRRRQWGAYLPYRTSPMQSLQWQVEAVRQLLCSLTKSTPALYLTSFLSFHSLSLSSGVSAIAAAFSLQASLWSSKSSSVDDAVSKTLSQTAAPGIVVFDKANEAIPLEKRLLRSAISVVKNRGSTFRRPKLFCQSRNRRAIFK